jgi:mitochondrial import receptor subunit TOM22
MFPESLRNLTSTSVDKSFNISKTLIEWSKVGLWVFASSFTILILPVICEQERSSLEEMQSQQQRQILLGPSAAQSASSAPNLIPGLMGPGGK